MIWIPIALIAATGAVFLYARLSDIRYHRKQAMDEMKKDIWRLERGIEGCDDYNATLDMNKKINIFFKRWYNADLISAEKLDTEYEKLHQKKERVKQKLFDRLVGKTPYDDIVRNSDYNDDDE